jgi:hypothetical protein
MSVKDVLDTIIKHLKTHKYNYVVEDAKDFTRIYVLKNDKLLMIITIITRPQNLGDTRGY